MQIGFYDLANAPLGKAVAALAAAGLKAGQRMLVVSNDEQQLDQISRTLWEERPMDFLANGRAGRPEAARQPILLGRDCTAENGARLVLFADGQWRDDGRSFDRAFLLFDEAGKSGARACWRSFDGQDDVERKYWKFEDGRWREGP